MDDQTGQEKRAIRRFPLHLPVKLTSGALPAQPGSTETKDVSSHGVSFSCDSELAVDTPIEFTLTLPTEVTMTEPISVRCLGKVVRVQDQQNGTYTVAAVIENYEFVADRKPAAAPAPSGEPPVK